MANLNKEYALRFVKFGIVGGTGILVNMGILYLFHDIWELPLAVSSIFAVGISIFTNFSLNDLWTWKNTKQNRKHSFIHRLWRYYVSASIGGGINYTVLLYLTHSAEMYYLLANLIGILLGTITNFLLGEYWVFKKYEST